MEVHSTAIEKVSGWRLPIHPAATRTPVNPSHGGVKCENAKPSRSTHSVQPRGLIVPGTSEGSQSAALNSSVERTQKRSAGGEPPGIVYPQLHEVM